MDILSIPESLESRIKLAIQFALLTESKTFKQLKEVTKATDGNLSSHLTRLETMGHITSMKQFIGKKPTTTYTLTDNGKQMLHEYVDLLQTILKGSKN